jgi:hypothetical protein
MELTININTQEAQLILVALSKLPLETSIDTWFKVKSQAEAQIAQAEAAPKAGGTD